MLGALELAYNTESTAQLPYRAYPIDIIGVDVRDCSASKTGFRDFWALRSRAEARLKILPTFVV
jgi:hypothetical protein